jgi:hypothetical protein
MLALRPGVYGPVDRQLRIPDVELVLACDEVVDLVVKLLAAHLDTGQSLPIIDKDNGEVDLVVCCSPVVVVIPDVEDEDG